MRIKQHLLDSVLGLAVTVVLFLLLELLFLGLDLGTPPDSASSSRGFDPAAAYLVPDPEVAGGWRTQFSSGKRQRQIPARGDEFRVLLFGGSNTEGFPAGVLQKELNRLNPGRKHEVHNLGVSGYGSERVALVLEQAVRCLQPDVVVIYAGHNEFVERGFRMDLEPAAGAAPGVLDRLVALGGRSRTVNLLAGAVEQEAAPAAPRPEEWQWEYEKFDDLTYEETLVYLDRYRENLRRMCAVALENHVGVLLSTVVHNRLAAPFQSMPSVGVTETEANQIGRSCWEAEQLLPDYVQPLIPKSAEDRVHGFDWRAVKQPPTDVPPPRGLPGRRACLGPFATQDPLLPPEWSWAPKVRVLYEALERFHARAPSAEERERLERAAARYEDALAIDPEHPRALFGLALAEYVLGRPEAEVLSRWELAARLDRAPRKANEATNERVRAVAGEVQGVLLFDSDALFRSRMPMGLVGWEWMTDHCHLNPGASEVLMRDFAEAITARWK